MSERRRCFKALGRNPFLQTRALRQRYDVWTATQWDAFVSHHQCSPLFVNFHKDCANNMAPFESVRIAQLLSRGGLVVSQPADPRDVSEYDGLVVFEDQFFAKTWSRETLALLGDGVRRERFRRDAAAAFAERFAPRKVLERADAWNASSARKTATPYACGAVAAAKEKAARAAAAARRGARHHPRGDGLEECLRALRDLLAETAADDPLRERLAAKAALYEKRVASRAARRREPGPS